MFGKRIAVFASSKCRSVSAQVQVCVRKPKGYDCYPSCHSFLKIRPSFHPFMHYRGVSFMLRNLHL